LAPTPSGYLHLGNLVNFVLTWSQVRREKGILWLRIDDSDAARMRPEYLEAIFRDLEWLGLDWDKGPVSPDDFTKNYSQLLRVDEYFNYAMQLKNTFACECSRKDIGGNLYPGTCSGLNLTLQKDQTALRIHASPIEIGDFIVWKKDGLPAYQLTSVVDDYRMGTNLFIRGEDLKSSSEAQRFLASQLGFENITSARYTHHSLLLDETGKKLSKSEGALSLKAMREAGATPRDCLQRVAKSIGLSKQVNSLSDFLLID
jgi:glutamyl-tRNA synthetase